MGHNRQAPRAPPAKRRKTTTQVDELKFDPEARKRKQQRIKHAQEQSAKIEKEEKVKARKEVCITLHICCPYQTSKILI
jgi:predicted DNA binding CopG/RHH family protein